jgi:hypothetical protein
MTVPKRLCLLAIVSGFAASGLAAGSARAGDDGQGGLIDSLSSLVGLGSKSAPEIDYRDRAPLVLPPKISLRQPVQAGAKRPTAWPVDPDVQRRLKEAEDDKVVTTLDGDHFRGRPISKQELLSGRAATKPETGPLSAECIGKKSRECEWVNPQVLQSQGIKMEAAPVLAAGQEPERKYLVQPPSGYRKVTKNVRITQSAPIEKEDTSPLSFFKKINPWDKDEDY